MHVAKVSDHSYNIVNCNNQFKGMRFRCLQELRAATGRIVAQYRQQWYEDMFEVDPSSSLLCRVRRNIISRSKKTAVCLEVHTLTSSQNQHRRAPGSHFILNVVFLKTDMFY